MDAYLVLVPSTEMRNSTMRTACGATHAAGAHDQCSGFVVQITMVAPGQESHTADIVLCAAI